MFDINKEKCASDFDYLNCPSFPNIIYGLFSRHNRKIKKFRSLDSQRELFLARFTLPQIGEGNILIFKGVEKIITYLLCFTVSHKKIKKRFNRD